MAKMPCGHWFGREHIRGIVDFQITTLKNNQVECNRLEEDGSACRKLFDLKKIGLITGWTKAEMNEVNEKLSLNDIEKKSVLCPHCNQPIYKAGFVGKKIQCPGCPTKAAFCIGCRELWVGT
jgi:NADH pyrophosphatase NudC (nudix superfamily)